MMQDDCSRRDFLKKFALLSAGTFVLGATTMACYGPMGPQPSSIATVSGMYFLDASSNLQLLRNSQEVPVDTTFKIHFFNQMNTTVDATVEFTDQNAVPFGQAWDSDFILSVAPSSYLLNATEYRLIVLDAESKTGEKINLAGDAEATFKTV